MLMYICLIIASVMFAVFIIFYLSASDANRNQLLKCLYKNQVDEIKNMQIELETLHGKIQSVQNTLSTMRHDPDPRLLKRQKALVKKITGAKKVLETYKKDGLGIFDMVPLAGYRVIRLLAIDSNNNMLSNLRRQCMHIKNEQDAMTYAIYLMSSLIGNLFLAAAMLFWGLGLGMALGMGTRSLLIGVVAAAIFALLGYIPYDNLLSQIRKREESIERDFPRVVSKLTLLTVSGLEVNQAWDMVASSDTGTLYEEMKRVIIDMDNNVPYAVAYTNFINRCDYSYTTKLATAIMQNMTKGNSEIVALLRRMNSESWSDYKHTARRKGEQISSKLLIPTLLLFAGMLILVLVPTVGGFNIF